MNITEADDTNTILEWAMRITRDGVPVADNAATAAARRLAVRARRVLGSGLDPDAVRLAAPGLLPFEQLALTAAQRGLAAGERPDFEVASALMLTVLRLARLLSTSGTGLPGREPAPS